MGHPSRAQRGEDAGVGVLEHLPRLVAAHPDAACHRCTPARREPRLLHLDVTCRLAGRERRKRCEFGMFFEHQVPRPWDDDDESPRLRRGARADRARRPHRHRLRVGGRAPLPRGVLALERARGVPRRGVAAHTTDPPRARHRADACRRSTIRRASRSASRRSTSSPAAASTSAPASRRRRPSSTASGSTPTTSARCGKRACASRCAA